MWHPEPGWQPLPGGAGPSAYGVWLAVVDGREVVVKRLAAPTEHDPDDFSDPRHFAYWRRPAEAALDAGLTSSSGLRAAPTRRVVEDAEGVTVVTDRVVDAGNSGLVLARALARFAGTEPGDRRWLARGQLRDRLTRVERRGGWATLARTPVADLADHLWRRRGHFLARLDELRQVMQHGDPVADNLLGREGEDVVAIDWSTLGIGPIGGDLGYLSLSAREGFEPLLEAYVAAMPNGLDPEDAVAGARVTAAYTVLTRAEWALARVAPGEGALAGKFRHPSVAPHLRALQRQFPQLEALLTDRRTG